jgi:hypothetical protein
MLIGSWNHLPVIALLLCTTACLDPCGNQVVNETMSPDKRMRAVIFERDCGATTDFNTQISILGENESLPHAGGNVFVEDSDHGASKYWAEVRWDSPERMVVRYPARARIFHKEARVKGVSITYEPVP